MFLSLHPLTGGAVFWALYITVAQFLARAHARLLTSAQPGGTRILLNVV